MDCLTHKVYLYCSWSYTMLSTEVFLVSLLLLLPVVQADANLTVSGVVRRIEKRSTFLVQPKKACSEGIEGSILFNSANRQAAWVCSGGNWLPFQLLPLIGSCEASPGKSCKEILQVLSNDCTRPAKSGTYWVKVPNDTCSGTEDTMQVYCEMNLDGGGWTLVWKHSPMQVHAIEPLSDKMKHYGTILRECSTLSAGWCNIPGKARFMPSEMMFAAYHEENVVYAYKATFNKNLDSDWTGGVFVDYIKVVDYCKSNNGVQPYPSTNHAGGDLSMLGLNFDKTSPYDLHNNCDMYRATLSNPRECRWENCCGSGTCSIAGLGFTQHTQQTVAIFVR